MEETRIVQATPAAALSAPAATVTAPPQATQTAAAVEPDVTLTQLESVQTVTPGQRFTTLRLSVSCPTSEGPDGFCRKSVLLGEAGFNSALELSDIKLFYNGQEVPSWTSHEGSLYRITPMVYWSAWRKGEIDIVATLSPNATSGEVTTVVAQIAVASFDKTLSLVSANDKVTVLALDFHAPVVISNVSAAMVPAAGKLVEVGHFDATCPQWVQQGCALSSFNVQLNGVVPGSEVQVFINNQPYSQYYADQDQLNIGMYPQYPMFAGQTITIQVFATMQSAGGTVQFFNLKTISGGMEVAPKLPQGCELALGDRFGCKG